MIELKASKTALKNIESFLTLFLQENNFQICREAKLKIVRWQNINLRIITMKT